MSDGPLAGRTALVTGASRGIGLAVARALVTAGARVGLVARAAAPLAARAAELGGGDAAVPLPCDLIDPAAVDALAGRASEALGASPDLLVNNAGIFRPAPIGDVTARDFHEAVETNLVAPFLLIHALLPAMRARARGHVITIGSVADRLALPGNAAYSATKYGVRGLHEVLRAELRGSGVRATLVSPGPTDTPIWDPVPLGTGRFPPREAMMPPAAVAEAVLFAATRPDAVNIDELRLSTA